MSLKSLKRCSSSVSNDSTVNILILQELRTKIQQDKIVTKCSQADIFRLNREDWWLATFLTSCKYDTDITFAVMVECLRWRINFEVECISLLSIKPLLDRQLMYIHGKDLTDNPILWMHLAHYRAGEPEFEKLFIFWMERHVMETRGAPLTILCDMSGTKMKNMDLNMFKFILKAVKYYYPSTVQDILVFDSPSVLSALWKVVKSWLDAGHPAIHHITKATIVEFIDPDYLQPHQGGDDQFVFTMNDIARCLPTPTIQDDERKEVDIDFADSKANLDNYPMRRSVKFDESEEETGRKTPLTLTRRTSKGPGKRVALPPSLRPVADKRMRATDVEWLKNAFVCISPRDELVLTKVDGEVDFVDVVAVKNNSTKGVMYKIKTTSPEKFRVRPSTGLIAPGITEVVRVYLQQEYKYSCTKEKFLLMAVETDEANTDNFTDVWRESPPESKVEHKVKCKVNDDGSTDSSNGRPERKSSLISSQQAAIDALRDESRRTANTQRLIIVVIGFLFTIQFIVMLYERSNYNSLRMAMETLSSTIITHNNIGTNYDKVHNDLSPMEEDL